MTERSRRVLAAPAPGRIALPLDTVLRLVAAFGGACLALPASAAQWQASGGVAASVLVTDNADFSDGDPDDGDTLLTVSPFVRLDVTGRRSELSLDGSLGFAHRDARGTTAVRPELALVAGTALVEGLLDFDAAAQVSQRATDDDLFADGNPFRVDDAEEVYRLSLGPTLSDFIGDRTRYDAGYTFATAQGSANGFVASDTHGFDAGLSTLIGRDGTALFLDGSHDIVRFENDDSARYGQLKVGVGQPLARTLTGIVTAGHDWLRLGEGVNATEGTSWAVGLEWKPSERVEAIVGYGEQAYGSQPMVSLKLAGRRSSVTLDWARTLAFVPRNTSAPGGDEEPLGDELATGFSPTATGRDLASIDERASLLYRLDGRVSSLSAGIAWYEREALDGGDSGTGNEATLSIERQLSRRVRADAGWTIEERRRSDAPRRARANLFRAGISVAF